MTLESITRGIDVPEILSMGVPSGKKTMYPKNSSHSSINRLESTSGSTTPQASSIGAIPVTFKPSSNYNSPNQQQTVPSTAYSSPAQYIIECPGNNQFQYLYGNQSTSYIAVPATMLSPTLLGAYSSHNLAASPTASGTYTSYGFVPSQGIMCTSFPSGSLSPLNTSKPTKSYPGCC
ncbi:hypothetical protein FG386_001043 [Cryptosporidium ryanae]|uniref:uncharacterized protein n=1 Tax=Cryptosporidium ryanae TaxID=515981 RepID=UPI00351A51DD|nr:hypothetical protein FG386_001043 [Cryptosporidium ryanae]